MLNNQQNSFVEILFKEFVLSNSTHYNHNSKLCNCLNPTTTKFYIFFVLHLKSRRSWMSSATWKTWRIARWTHSIPTNEIIDVTCKIILVHIIKVCRIVCRGRMLKDFFPFLLLQTRYQNNLFLADFKLWCSFSV